MAGAGLKTVIAPAALAIRRASVAVAVGISCPTSTTSPALGRESLERLADVPGLEGGVGAARDRDAVLAPGIDEDQRDAGGLIGERP